MPEMGTKDRQTVMPDGRRSEQPAIAGVYVRELGNVLTRSGFMTEICRSDWAEVGITVRQVNWVCLNPGAVTDWHVHRRQTDRIIGVGGSIRLALWDGREQSPTCGATEVVRLSALRPVLVVVPPGVWHGLRNESGDMAGYVNVIDQLYEHEDPDNWRSTPGSGDMPDIL
ncbi:MAG: hypothetical protein FJW23_07890 [Acidimicrobiia bacterium]|nr:hypothetical protein [Acidimicrobiia bacterium]